MTKSLITITAVLAIATTSAFAQNTSEPENAFGLNAGVTTLGPTLEATWRVNENFGLRAPIGYATYSYDGSIEGKDYTGDIELGGFGLIADYYPTGKSLRLSGGLFKTNYGATLNRDLQYGPFSTTLVTEVSQKSDISPYIGVGYEQSIGKRLALSLDAGTLLGSGFVVKAYDTQGYATQEQIEAENESLRDAVNDIDVIPYVSLTLGYRF